MGNMRNTIEDSNKKVCELEKLQVLTLEQHNVLNKSLREEIMRIDNERSKNEKDLTCKITCLERAKNQSDIDHNDALMCTQIKITALEENLKNHKEMVNKCNADKEELKKVNEDLSSQIIMFTEEANKYKKSLHTELKKSHEEVESLKTLLEDQKEKSEQKIKELTESLEKQKKECDKEMLALQEKISMQKAVIENNENNIVCFKDEINSQHETHLS